ncbi:MAG: ABC transporter substrate-binding protein [Actinomycetota bacterium]
MRPSKSRTHLRLSRLVIVVTGLLLMAACGGDQEAEPAVTSTSDVAADGETSTTSTAPDATTTTAAAGVVFPRTVEHQLGEFEQTEPPTRVFIAASEILGEAAISLGVTPVARLDWFGGAPDPVGDDYGLAALDQVEVLGPVFVPNAEQIIGVNPDLVFIFGGFQDAVHDQLSPQVNTVAIDSGADWPAILTEMADALAIPNQSDVVLAEYDARLEALAAGPIGAEYAGKSVAFVTPFVAFEPRLTSPTGLVADAFRIAGIETWDSAGGDIDGEVNEAEGIISFSKELAGSITADAVVIVLEGEGGDTPTREDFLADPVWSSIPAVVSGDFVILTNNITANAGPISHYLFFDDLERALAESG